MKRYRLLLIPCLAMATALSWGGGQSRAESQDTSQPPAKSGPFRDPESVPKLRSTTNAQRMDAARRQAEIRAAALRDAAANNPAAPTTASPQDVKGGAK